jgi:hypothetical protein
MNEQCAFSDGTGEARLAAIEAAAQAELHANGGITANALTDAEADRSIEWACQGVCVDVPGCQLTRAALHRMVMSRRVAPQNQQSAIAQIHVQTANASDCNFRHIGQA